MALLQKVLTGELSYTGSTTRASHYLLSSAGLSFTGKVNRLTKRALVAGLSFTGTLIGTLFKAAKKYVSELSGGLSFISAPVANMIPWASWEHAEENPFLPEIEASISAEQAFSGTHSLRVVGKGGVSTVLNLKNLTRSVGPAQPGVAYTLSAYSFPETTRREWMVIVIFRDESAKEITRISNRLREAVVGTWGRLSITGTAPTGTAYVGVEFIWFSAEIGEAHFLDAIQLTANAEPIAYADGDSSGYYWAGTPGQSITVANFVPVVVGKALAGGASFTGSVNNSSTYLMSAGVSFVGAASIFTSRALSGGLSFIGGLAKQTSYLLNGGLDFVGTLPTGKMFVEAFSAALGFAGTVAKTPGKLLIGGLSFAGAISRSIGVALEAGASLSGSLSRSTSRGLAAALGFVGEYTRSSFRSLASSLSPGGQTNRATTYLQQGSLEPAGSTAKGLQQPLIGSLAFQGAISRFAGRVVSSGLSFVGAARRSSSRSLAGTLTMAGEIRERARIFIVAFQGAISFEGRVGRRFSRVFSAVLSLVGDEAHGKRHKTTLVLEIPDEDPIVVVPQLPEVLNTGDFISVRGKH